MRPIASIHNIDTDHVSALDARQIGDYRDSDLVLRCNLDVGQPESQQFTNDCFQTLNLVSRNSTLGTDPTEACDRFQIFRSISFQDPDSCHSPVTAVGPNLALKFPHQPSACHQPEPTTSVHHPWLFNPVTRNRTVNPDLGSAHCHLLDSG